MQEIADELFESWINGNRTYVIDTITQVSDYQSAAKVVLLSSLITIAMSQEERMVFRRMLLDRINTR